MSKHQNSKANSKNNPKKETKRRKRNQKPRISNKNNITKKKMREISNNKNLEENKEENNEQGDNNSNDLGGLSILKKYIELKDSKIKNEQKLKAEKKFKKTKLGEKSKNLNNKKEIFQNNDNSTENINKNDKGKEEISLADKNDLSSLNVYQDFNFFKNNKEKWCKYLDLNNKNDDDAEYNAIYARILELTLLKKNNVDLLLEIINKIGIFMDLRNNSINNYECEDKIKSISEKWFLSQFKGYYFDVFKRRGNISNYKIRNNKMIEEICLQKWKKILYFLGFKIDLKYENIYDYWWFIWYLPNQLLIIWLSKLDLINYQSNWWIRLLNDWRQYWFEILRSRGIKNWLMNFISED